jgi:hypothetical protein
VSYVKKLNKNPDNRDNRSYKARFLIGLIWGGKGMRKARDDDK